MLNSLSLHTFALGMHSMLQACDYVQYIFKRIQYICSLKIKHTVCIQMGFMSLLLHFRNETNDPTSSLIFFIFYHFLKIYIYIF
jgi:hypothetical protein